MVSIAKGKVNLVTIKSQIRKGGLSMLKYFFKPLSCIDVVVIVLILIWLFLFVFNKNKMLQIPMFIASHMLFYFSKVILNEGNFLLSSTIVLFVSFSVLIFFSRSKSKEEMSLRRKRIYFFFTVALTVVVIFGCILMEASSILMPPPH